MKLLLTNRGFEWLEHPSYSETPEPIRLASASSAIGEYDDAMERPGTSFLWIGDHLHLNRGEVQELAARLQSWCNTGSLRLAGERKPKREELSP